jgi:hypothetical protein
MRPTQFRICSEPGCPEVVEGGGRCPEHLRLARSRNDARRRTSVERGYDHRWYRIAERYRKRHPVCKAAGCEPPASTFIIWTAAGRSETTATRTCRRSALHAITA